MLEHHNIIVDYGVKPWASALEADALTTELLHSYLGQPFIMLKMRPCLLSRRVCSSRKVQESYHIYIYIVCVYEKDKIYCNCLIVFYMMLKPVKMD